MFIGHFGTGFAAKKFTKRPSLGTLFLAAQFIDLLFPLFIVLGIESFEIDPGNTAVTPLNFLNYPFSHSLVGVLFWAVLFGGSYFFIRKDFKAGIVLSILVFSHWLLDFISHRPDLPLFPASQVFLGLGLWYSKAATILVEGSIFVTGVYFYLRTTTEKNKTGKYALYSLILFFIIIYFMNLFGPVPPAKEPVVIMLFTQWLLILWGYWIDRNRKQN